MKLNLFPGFDIDWAREANPRMKITMSGTAMRGTTITIVPKMPCPDCGEPMANGGAVGWYCTAKGCDHDTLRGAKLAGYRLKGASK